MRMTSTNHAQVSSCLCAPNNYCLLINQKETRLPNQDQPRFIKTQIIYYTIS